MQITIFGQGHLGKAIAKNLEMGQNQVNFINFENNQKIGQMAILAVPYPAIDDIIGRYGKQLAGKIVVDATNPINFKNWSMLVPAESSSAAQTAKKLPNSHVLKAFNTATAVTLKAGALKNGIAPQVLVAGDDQSAKEALKEVLAKSPLEVIDVGALARARDLESLGMIELSMAANKKLPMDGGFLMIK